MAHHLDSPIARKDVRLDITDLYVFRGETGTAFVMNLCPSIAGNIPVPGYHPEGRYEFKIDLDNDAIEDLTYRFTFDERDLAGKQRFVLRRITGAEAAEPSAAGTVIAQGASGEAVTTPAGVRIWVGKAGDPFWIYWESHLNLYSAANVSIPAAVSVFPGENYQAPRSWAERAYHKLIYYNEADEGGHYAAWEQPEIFSQELRAGFRSLREAL